MDPFDICEAKTRLSQRVDRTAAGEDVVIGRNGRPAARIARIEAASRIRFGGLAVRLEVPDDFDSPLPDDVLAAFEGR